MEKYFGILTAKHPAPWKIREYSGGEFDVIDASGGGVFEIFSYRGDGDLVYLGREELAALVEIVNRVER